MLGFSRSVSVYPITPCVLLYNVSGKISRFVFLFIQSLPATTIILYMLLVISYSDLAYSITSVQCHLKAYLLDYFQILFTHTHMYEINDSIIIATCTQIHKSCFILLIQWLIESIFVLFDVEPVLKYLSNSWSRILGDHHCLMYRMLYGHTLSNVFKFHWYSITVKSILCCDLDRHNLRQIRVYRLLQNIICYSICIPVYCCYLGSDTFVIHVTCHTLLVSVEFV